jgi:hypothetical protein
LITSVRPEHPLAGAGVLLLVDLVPVYVYNCSIASSGLVTLILAKAAATDTDGDEL